jgi:ribosome-binding protein aMBF1 (putative translation factor)
MSGGLREQKFKREIEQARELAAIQLETERQLAAIRGQSQTLPQTPRVSRPTVEPDSRKAVVEPLLLAKGWSQLDWANEAHVAHTTVTDYLEGRRNPYPSTRLKLAKALGVAAHELPA